MKVSITMSENFDWGYNEAETNEHLIAVEKTKVALTEKFAKSEKANLFDDEASDAEYVLTRMGSSLFYYAIDKNYNLAPYFDFNSRNKEEAKREKSDDLEIDESQFEVPNQSQKTL